MRTNEDVRLLATMVGDLSLCLFVIRGPGDSKLLCGPTTIFEGKER